jgi:hypothetical protein
MPLDVMKLKPGRCRYPLGDDGEPVMQGQGGTSQGRPSPYCAVHHQLCHAGSDQKPLRPPAERRRAGHALVGRRSSA